MTDQEQRDVTIGGNILNLAKARKQTTLDVELGSGDVRESLLALAKTKAPDPEIFETHEPYFYFAEISNDLVNCYYLSFQKPMLESWVDSLKDGVQFQAFHENSAPIGHSIYGWQENSDGRERVIGAFYAIPGVQLNQYMSNDSFIAGIKSGSIRDVSVGMFVDTCECNICSGDPMDYWGKWMGTADCEHYLGEKYAITDSKGKETGEFVTCTGLVQSGQLNEVSSVYKGGAPMAGIIPAMQLSRSQGLLDPKLQDRLEHRFGIGDVVSSVALPKMPAWMTPEQLEEIRNKAKTVSIPAKETTVPKQTDASVSESTEVEFKLADLMDAKTHERIKKLDIDASNADGNFDLSMFVDGVLDKMAKLEENIESLEVDAKVGREYKTEKIDDTIAAGIRANGNEWKADQYRAMLERCDIGQVKMFLEDLTKQGDAKFASTQGGSNRVTVDGEASDAVTVESGEESKKFQDPRFKS